MKKVITLYFVLILISCKSVNENHQLINVILGDKIFTKKCDSIDVEKKLSVLNTYFLKKYKQEEIDFIKGVKSTSNIINWKNNSEWVLTENDIEEMLNETSNKRKRFKKNKIQSEITINLKNEPLFLNEIEKNKEITKRIKNCNYFIQYSEPVYNKKRTKAIVMEKEILMNESIYYIFVKENNKWKIVGFTLNSSE